MFLFTLSNYQLYQYLRVRFHTAYFSYVQVGLHVCLRTSSKHDSRKTVYNTNITNINSNICAFDVWFGKLMKLKPTIMKTNLGEVVVEREDFVTTPKCVLSSFWTRSLVVSFFNIRNYRITLSSSFFPTTYLQTNRIRR